MGQGDLLRGLQARDVWQEVPVDRDGYLHDRLVEEVRRRLQLYA